MAILELTDHIHQGFERNEFTIGVFVDLRKAYRKFLSRNLNATGFVEFLLIGYQII